MYRNIIKNNSHPLPPKAWPLHPKLGCHLPYQIHWWCMITVTPCSTHYSNQLLTHSLTIGKKIESPRRSLRSLWGLIKTLALSQYLFCFGSSFLEYNHMYLHILHQVASFWVLLTHPGQVNNTLRINDSLKNLGWRLSSARLIKYLLLPPLDRLTITCRRDKLPTFPSLHNQSSYSICPTHPCV